MIFTFFGHENTSRFARLLPCRAFLTDECGINVESPAQRMKMGLLKVMFSHLKVIYCGS